MGRRAWIVALLALAVALATATAVLFVWPREDAPVRADAVIVLAGGRSKRLAKGLRLMERGVAPTLVISDGRDPYWPQANRLCDGPAPFTVICFRPAPYSTRGEAERVRRIAAARHWRSIVVVTSRYHVTRARVLFERCFRGRVQVTGAGYSTLRLPQYLATEWGKLAYAVTFSRGC